MGRSRNFSFFLLAVLLAAPAAAQTNAVCDDLRGQLADIPEVIGTSQSSRQYSGVIARQNIEIRRLLNDMRDRGCASADESIVNAEDAAVCDEMHNSLADMQDNLRALMDQRGEAQQNGSAEDRLRDRIQAALRENGCEEPAASDADTIITNRPETPPPTPEQQALRTDTFIQPLDRSGGPPRGYYYDQPAPMNYPPGGSYGADLQTVCVRTCDGGFFPLTTNATPLNFQRDAETCARMCPGVQTELYVRDLPRQESSEMVSAATGTPYGAAPYAFAFRKRAPGEKSSCTCNMSAYYEEMRREETVRDPQMPARQGSITTIETRKPQLSRSEPSQSGQSLPQAAAAAPPQTQPEERPYDPSTSKVRQVGPQFLTTDQGRIDLKHPLTPGPQPEQ